MRLAEREPTVGDAGAKATTYGGLRQRIADSETAKAAGLAIAALAANAVAVLVTVIFTRLLGEEGYGSLAALLSAFTILAVIGSSLQVVVARDTAMGKLGDAANAIAIVRGWSTTLGALLIGTAVASVVLREHLGELMGVRSEPWAVAAVAPTALLWLLLSLQRGVLQGLHSYAPVGASIVLEAVGRLVCGCVLVLAGAGVAGAYLGTPLAMAATSVALVRVMRKRARVTHRFSTHTRRRLGSLLSEGWAPIAALLLLAALQNIDVIVAKREMEASAAGVYAAAVVAAKLVVWIAIGIGLHLLPTATLHAARGVDPRPVFLRSLGLLALVAVPSLVVFVLAPETILRLAFGPSFVGGADALTVLGVAMTCLAISTLSVQYMLALHRTAFLWALGVLAIAEPLFLSRSDLDMSAFAVIVLAVQAGVAMVSLGLSLVMRPASRLSPT